MGDVLLGHTRAFCHVLGQKKLAELPRTAMSRLIVKGLPPYLTDVRLREHFAQKGSVTDAKLMKRPDGTSRRFGFVGYRTEEEAQEAKDYFDRTYIDTARISVAIAKKIGDEELQKRNEAKSKAQSTAAKEPKAEKKRKAEPSASSGASFEEFLSVMAPKLKRKSWQNNEDLEAAQPAPAPTEEQPAKKPKKKRTEAEPSPALPAAPSDQAAADEQLSDLEYMRRRMRHTVAGGEEQKAFEQSDSEAESEASESESEPEEIAQENARRRAKLEAEQRKEEENVDTIMQSGRLFVRNLPFTATEEELESFFSAYGPLAQVRILTRQVGCEDDSQYRDNRGIADADVILGKKIVDVSEATHRRARLSSKLTPGAHSP